MYPLIVRIVDKLREYHEIRVLSIARSIVMLKDINYEVGKRIKFLKFS